MNVSDISISKKTITINIPLSKLNANEKSAQLWLDTQVMTSMMPYIPLRTGALRQMTQARSTAMAGTGEVCAATGVYGRFQYAGVVMVDPKNGSPWARRGAIKVTTGKPLHYSQPSARPEWFEVAKAKDLRMWVDGVKERFDE